LTSKQRAANDLDAVQVNYLFLALTCLASVLPTLVSHWRAIKQFAVECGVDIVSFA